MRAARPVFDSDVRPFHGKTRYSRNALLSFAKVAQTGEHVVGTARNHGRKAAGNAGRNNRFDSLRNVSLRSQWVVEIDTRKPVHLYIHKAGRQPRGVRFPSTDLPAQNGFPKGQNDRFVRRDINPGTFHIVSVLFTIRPQASHSRLASTLTNGCGKNLLKYLAAHPGSALQQGDGLAGA
jgi:hypothetical protein